MSVILWITAALHFVSAIFAASSVSEDGSNAALMTALTVAFLAGAIIDALAAARTGEKRSRRIEYVGGKYERK